MSEMLHVRLPSDEKKALRVLAAEEDMNLTDYVLKILRENTQMKRRAVLLAKHSPHVEEEIHMRTNDLKPTPEVA
jgi:hypothetical protein